MSSIPWTLPLVERLLEEFVFERVDQSRFERKPNQWCCLVEHQDAPRHTLLIKTCLMEHATIEQRVHHLVEMLPFGSRTILALDGKSKNFLRGYDKAHEKAFNAVAKRLLEENWIDKLLLPPTKDEVVKIHVDWFCFTADDLKGWEIKEESEADDDLGLTWTHDVHGVQVSTCCTVLPDKIILRLDSYSQPVWSYRHWGNLRNSSMPPRSILSISVRTIWSSR